MKARIEGMDSGSDAPSVSSAKNRGCTAGAVDGTYSCEVEVDLVMPGMGAQETGARRACPRRPGERDSIRQDRPQASSHSSASFPGSLLAAACALPAAASAARRAGSWM